MRNVLVNFSKKAIDNITSAMGAGADLDTFSSITELNNSLNRGGNYDKALLWHTYPVEGGTQIMAEYDEELEQLAHLLAHSPEAPEVWVMEKTREACAYDYERLSSVSDLAIVHIANMGGIGPVLQSALGSSISAIKVNKSLVGLYGEAEYNEDMEQTLASFDDDDEFEATSEDDFADADAEQFEDADESDFEDADESDFEDATENDFKDDFETEDDFGDSDDFEEAEPAQGAVAPPPQVQGFTDAEDEFDEFEGGSNQFEEADDAPVMPQEPYGDEERDFDEPSIVDFDASDFSDAPSGGFGAEVEEDEFEARETNDFDDFEEAPAPTPVVAPVPVVAPAPMGEVDEFAGSAPVQPQPQPVQTQAPVKKGLFGKKPKKQPAPAPVAPTPEQTAQALDDAQVAAVENAELSKSALNVLKSVCSKRCCQITVTGERGAGKSTVAMNLGNILSKHFKVLVVDMDGETRGISYIQNDIIQNIAPEEPGMRSIFSAGLNSGNKPFNVRNNLAISTVGLASDTFKTNEVFTVNNVTRAHNQLMKSFDFIIYDIPLEAALDKLTSFITTSYVLYCVEASNYGFMNLLFRIGNLEDSSVAQQLTENAIIVPTKSSGYSYVGNIPVKNTKQALKAVQSIGDELVGGECELDFASMEFAAALPFNDAVQHCVGSKNFYSDTRVGFKEYSKLIASVFGL